MKVMLVQPNSESVVKTVVETTGVPLGLAYLGAVLREFLSLVIFSSLYLLQNILKSALSRNQIHFHAFFANGFGS